jgi:hypothetical protein
MFFRRNRKEVGSSKGKAAGRTIAAERGIEATVRFRAATDRSWTWHAQCSQLAAWMNNKRWH